MNLNEILNKTKKKNEKINITLRPASIALEDRPYSIKECEKQIGEQLGNNKGTIREQLGNNKGTIEEQPMKAIGEQLGNNKGTIREQLGNQIGNANFDLKDNFNSQKEEVNKLYGIQKEILFYIVENCASSGKLMTTAITNESFRTIANTDADSIKTSIKRLILKGLIERKSGKKGKGGYSIFRIQESVRNEVLDEIRKLRIREQLGNNKGTNRGTTAPSSSCEVLILKEKEKTTTELPENWKSLTVDALDERGIPFRVSHVERIYQEGKMTAEMLGSSLSEFIFDYDNNHLPDFKKGGINFLMGIFLKGQPYVSEHYASMMNTELKRLAALAEQREREKNVLAEKAEEGRFYEWIDSQSPDFLRQSIPDAWTKTLYDKHSINHPAVRAALKQAYSQQQESAILEPA